MTSPIHTTRTDAILEVTIDRPKANAIDAALREAILNSTGESFFYHG